MNISILAAGTWGTALAVALSAQHRVTIWSISEEEIRALRETHKHKNLPGMVIPDSVLLTTDLQKAVTDADIVIVATPSIFVRSTVTSMKPYLNERQIIACVAKGIEAGTHFTMTEIIEDVLKSRNPTVALSGPTHAEEVAVGLPTLIVSASEDLEAAKTVQSIFAGTCIRPYTNCDVRGVELCGALKNIVALACGIAAGLGYGDNAKAAIITRGMAEIRRLGLAMGASEATFSGLAGIGDLIVTATSMHSRNNRCGMLIGQGRKPEDAVREVGMVVEGINALPAAMELSRKLQVEMPICEAVNKVIGGEDPARIVQELMARDRKDEITGERTESALLGNL